MNEANEETPILNADVEAPTPNYLLKKHTLHTYIDSLDDHKSIRWSYFAFSFTFNAVFLGIIIGLLASSGDCDAPLRKWLIYYGISCAVAIVLDVILELMISFRYMIKEAWVIPLFLVVTVLLWAIKFVLFLVGNFIVFKNNGCQEEYEDGYTVVTIIVLLNYVAIGLLLGLLTCFCCYGIVLARIINESIS